MKQVVCDWTTLVERRRITFRAGTRTLLVAAADGMPYAIADKCPHLGFPLSAGSCENGICRCKEHGLEIDVRTGLVRATPKAAFLKLTPDQLAVRTYPCAVEAGKVVVDL